MLRSPSSRNLRPWRFVFVSDPTVLQALSHAKTSYSDFLAGAPLGVVVCADTSASDCWIEDCSIAAVTLQLTATDLGLGSCWIQIRAREHGDGRPAEEYVREVLGLSARLGVLCIVSVGYPDVQPEPKARKSLPWERIEVR